MSVPRPPAPGILGPRPASHQAYLATSGAAPTQPFLHRRSLVAWRRSGALLWLVLPAPGAAAVGSRTPSRLALGPVTH